MQSLITRNNIKIIGKGDQSIVFAHGLACDQTIWKYITPEFEENYRIILFDYVGSGNSDQTAYSSKRYSTLNGYAQDLLEVFEFLKLEQAIFVGHSVSGMIGALASIEQPTYFKQLIMIAPSPCYINDNIDYVGGFDKEDAVEFLTLLEMNFIGWATITAQLAMNTKESNLIDELQSNFSSGNPLIVKEFAHATFFSDHRKDLSNIEVPTTIIQCSEDSMVPLEVGEYLQKEIRNSTLKITNIKGHYPHLTDPKQLVKILNECLD